MSVISAVGGNYPDPRTIRHALNVLQRLPAEALADLTERLIDRLDTLGPDADLEPEDDACEAGECGGFLLRSDGLAGNSTDAEPGLTRARSIEMSDRNKADITGKYVEHDEVEAAWQEMHASAIGPVELCLLADAHEHLTKLHELDAGVVGDHLERATELRKLAVDLTWFLPKSSPRRPPINDRLEQSLLGELMRRRLWHPLPKGLSASDFGDPAHGAIYSAMQRCYASQLPYDLDNVAADLRDKPDIEELGGTIYLAQLVAAAKALEPTLHVGAAASTISETAHARSLMQQLYEVGRVVRTYGEIVCSDIVPGAGRGRAHLLAMDLIGVARDVLDRSAGWA